MPLAAVAMTTSAAMAHRERKNLHERNVSGPKSTFRRKERASAPEAHMA
eukprot:CAMPEP_0198512900 /NCGR_PEP_ID=MMETSP1462-20131121/15736_1 /TAXON_ID=1333877 /ORGANISM="Brandtodinium nutriculum, Strain RCC3387" /LENGTH=48 /DNA_ID= /DNA_START= /DNA_END= /DNA_ORIENTATION=